LYCGASYASINFSAGGEKRPEIVAAKESGEIRRDIAWHVAQARCTIKKMPDGPAKDIRRALERIKAQVRARVEHSFHVVKNLFPPTRPDTRDCPRTRHSCLACSDWPTS